MKRRKAVTQCLKVVEMEVGRVSIRLTVVQWKRMKVGALVEDED